MTLLLLIIALSAVIPHGGGSSRTHRGYVTTALPPIRRWKRLAIGVRQDNRSTIADSSNHGGACELRGTRSWMFQTDSTCFYFVFLLRSVSLLSKIKAWKGGRPVWGETGASFITSPPKGYREVFHSIKCQTSTVKKKGGMGPGYLMLPSHTHQELKEVGIRKINTCRGGVLIT